MMRQAEPSRWPGRSGGGIVAAARSLALIAFLLAAALSQAPGVARAGAGETPEGLRAYTEATQVLSAIYLQIADVGAEFSSQFLLFDNWDGTVEDARRLRGELLAGQAPLQKKLEDLSRALGRSQPRLSAMSPKRADLLRKSYDHIEETLKTFGNILGLQRQIADAVVNFDADRLVDVSTLQLDQSISLLIAENAILSLSMAVDEGTSPQVFLSRSYHAINLAMIATLEDVVAAMRGGNEGSKARRERFLEAVEDAARAVAEGRAQIERKRPATRGARLLEMVDQFSLALDIEDGILVVLRSYGDLIWDAAGGSVNSDDADISGLEAELDQGFARRGKSQQRLNDLASEIARRLPAEN